MINNAIEHKVKVYQGSNHESFVWFQLTIKDIIKNKELKDEWLKFKKEAADAKVAFNALPIFNMTEILQLQKTG